MECTRLGFYERYDDQNPMAQLSPQKRKKRRVQLREAQRRRRARLKEESKSFLQIILSQEMLLALRHYSDLVGKPLHACAAELIERGLGPELNQQQESSSSVSSRTEPKGNRSAKMTPELRKGLLTKWVRSGQLAPCRAS